MQPYSRTKKGQKKAARKLRQAAKLATIENATLGSEPVKSLESTTHTKIRSEPFNAVVTATHKHVVDPVMPYTEAARDVTNTQFYIMIWIEAILRSIITIKVLIVSQVLCGRQDHMRHEDVFHKDKEECRGVTPRSMPCHSEEDVSAMGIADVKKTNRRSLVMSYL